MSSKEYYKVLPYILHLKPLGIWFSGEDCIIYFPEETKEHLSGFKFDEISWEPASIPSKTLPFKPYFRVTLVSRPEKFWHKSRHVKILLGPAFGTAEHPTTARMIKIILGLKKYKSCIDFGAGTGILGLVFEKITRGRCYYVEIDPLALDNLRANLAMNGSKGCIVKLEDVKLSEVILANVYLETIINNIDILLSKKPKLLVLSGIRASDDLTLLQKRLAICSLYEDDGWLTCVALPRGIN
ncbi:MAG: 50S ribosomal protein L11 methyltransferase [Deltaproteobacteria bacterium]|nr:50S ribosomal protein L11 methyltransferase [Deltaproteobacteria bacterium]